MPAAAITPALRASTLYLLWCRAQESEQHIDTPSWESLPADVRSLWVAFAKEVRDYTRSPA